MNRVGLIKFIKFACRYLKWDDTSYRRWLLADTGKRSCTACTDEELARLAGDLRRRGVPEKPIEIPGGTGADRPTLAQWRLARGLAKDLGMSGKFNEPAFITFAKRQAKVDHPRWLDRSGMSKLITGLKMWKRNRAPSQTKAL